MVTSEIKNIAEIILNTRNITKIKEKFGASVLWAESAEWLTHSNPMLLSSLLSNLIIIWQLSYHSATNAIMSLRFSSWTKLVKKRANKNPSFDCIMVLFFTLDSSPIKVRGCFTLNLNFPAKANVQLIQDIKSYQESFSKKTTEYIQSILKEQESQVS